MAIILDGSIAAASIRTEIAEAVKSSVAKGNRPPGLVAILVGEDGASQTYVGAKKTACDEVDLRVMYVVSPPIFQKPICWQKSKRSIAMRPSMD